MTTKNAGSCLRAFLALLTGMLVWIPPLGAQILINVDFGVGSRSPKAGFAATGQSTNDYWNLYRHYDPKFVPGTALVSDGLLQNLKLSDGAETKVSVAVTNAPGVWGNASSDAMYDTYLFSQNGSNITVTIKELESGRYHFYLYGHADADVTGEQNSVFTLRSGTNTLGPLTTLGSPGWKATSPWQERYQYVVFRDVQVMSGQPVIVDVAAGPNGVAVLNGLQIISRGTSPPQLLPTVALAAPATLTNLIFREIRYEGKVSEHEARFAVDLQVESMTTNEISATLFEGNVAVMAPALPEGLRIVSSAKRYRLFATAPGSYQFKLELVAKITRAEPWNQISFLGPPAAIAIVSAQANDATVEMQLLSGTSMNLELKAASKVQGVLGADRTLSLRWQSKTTEIARKSLVTVDTVASAQITPTVIKFTTQLRYEILQAAVPKLTIALPASHALTKLQGEQIRDWQVKTEGERQLLTVEFIKPVEKSYALTLFSEQTVAATPLTTQLSPPQPLDIERESGSFTVSADDMLVEIDSTAGLRQVNAVTGTLAAYRFHGRPFTLAAKLKRIEPVLKVADRVTARLEETRLLVTHVLTLNVEKAGIYAVELIPQPGFVVADVRGEGVEEWKLTDSPEAGSKVLRVNFSNRVLGVRKIEVQLEQPHKTFPEQITVASLPVLSATNQTAQIGAAPALGIRLKTAGELTGLREIPVTSLAARADDLLAFAAEQADWKLTLAAERLPARVVADVFNLITIGDGLVGGSATIRYGLINQGVQEFQVALPAHWKNVEFTGPNIRRKETNAPAPAVAAKTNFVVWTISLQDKAWGGYTLVVTYDYQFDPKKATLDVGGAHALNVERETGSVAITTAASLELKAKSAEPLRLIDQTELAETDRALITRPVLLAYRYTGDSFQLTADVTRHQELAVLDAVADRTQLTSVLTEAGEMLTQASFMVKNNDKQFQRFQLPGGAELWSCFVNNQSVKAERDGEWLLVSLPRGANRDEAFAVDIVYKQKLDPLKARLFPRTVQLAAPKTDVPNTYAEWQIYVPLTQRLSGFGGSMTVARGTTYSLRDAWRRFTEYYAGVFREHSGVIIFLGGGALLVVSLIISALRRGWRGAGAVLVVFCVIAILASISIPNLNRARYSTIASMGGERASGDAIEQLRDQMVAQSGPAPQQEGRYAEPVMVDPATGLPLPGIKPEELHRFRDLQARLPSAQSQPLPAEKPAAPGFMLGAVVSETGPGARGGQVGGGGGAAPTVAGLRSIRIDIPRDGQSFTFTKVLNVSDEPLSVKMSAMQLKWFQRWRSICQLATFLAGLIIVWTQWHRHPRRSLWLSIGLALVIGSVTSLLIALRTLHMALIAGLPVVAVALLIWLLWKFFPRSRHGFAPEPETRHTEPGTSHGIPPAVAAITLFLSLSAFAAAPGFAREADDQSATRNPQSAITNAVSIISAQYVGTVRERMAQFDATIQVSSFATNQIVALFGEDVAIQEFSTKGSDVRLLRQGNSFNLRLGEKGSVTVQLKLVAKLSGDVSKRQLAFSIPPALSSKLSVTIDEPEADVEFPTAISFQRRTDQKETRVEAILGSGDRVEMFWTPRVKRVTDMAASIFAQNTTLVTVGGGVVNTRSTLDYQVTQGELRQVKVRLPAGQRLLRVEGDLIRTWELREEGAAQILTVDLLKGISPAYKLTVETEKILDKLPAQLKVEAPQVMDVIRETGLLGLRGSEELSLTVENARDLQRVDAAEFAKVSQADGLLSAYRFLKPGFQLTARAEAIQPQIEAVVRNSIRIGFEQVSVSAQIDYTIKKAGVFALKLAVPEGYKIESVTGGSNVLQWVEKAEPRVLDVALKERTIGAFTLRVHLLKSHKDLPKTIDLAGVHPLETHKLTGFVSVSAEPGAAVKTTTFEGLTEIPAASLGDGKPGGGSSSVQAYKFVSGEPAASSAWKLAVTTEIVESWVRAEVVNTLSVTETLLSGRALVRYDIQNAPVKEFRLKVPAAYKNIEILGTNIRRRDQNGEEWRVELQNKVRGVYTLTVTWEQPRNAKTNATVDVSAIEALGVERETGFVMLLARPPLQVTEKSATDQLIRIDARELPDWAGVSSAAPDAGAEAPVLVYRYLRPGYKLAVEAKRFEEAAVLQALVDNARLTTVVADDGQMMTEMSLGIRNNGLQHLVVELPAGAKVWSAFVAGQPVRPSRRGDKLMLPLERSGADGAPITVELTYVSAQKFPRTKGDVELISPKLDVPLKNARWELYLPPDYAYTKFQGSMTHEVGVAPVVQVYSSREYFKQENEKKAAKQVEVGNFLSNARKGLASGKLKDANYDYNQALRLDAFDNKEAKKELDELKRDLSRVQSSNLIEAQRNYTRDNVGRYSDSLGLQTANQPAQQQGEQAAQMLQYDADAAEQQWGALQRAQEVSVAKVQPLRANLPTRGQRHSFTQVLQTEVNKPMTIQFAAANVKEVGWFKKVLYGAGGFLMLWIFVAVVVNRRPASRIGAEQPA